ncbi:MAG: 4-(cytidine 5'-diphospho)-2-C-methyl-D-erythritol kinase [Chitinophagaceae bacterium]
MVVFPNAKINLGLSVIAKRNDGYHDLETVFYPVNIRDSLEMIIGHPLESTTRTNDLPGIHFSTSGMPIQGIAADNLCIRAVNLLSHDFEEIGPVQIHLHKHIPMGAGLGGGSSNAAFTLVLLNELFELSLSRQQLIDYAAVLGSDCPFFIINKPCLASSRGEIMEEITLDLSSYQMIFISPGIHVNTGWAFAQLNPEPGSGRQSLRSLIRTDPSEWKNVLVNDFELPVFSAWPELREIRDEFYASGATYSAMTGSGSTVFALYEPGKMVLPTFPPHYKVMKG